MNGQIVLCKGINDGAELDRSIRDLTGYIPNLASVSIVPVGLTKYREGLYPLVSYEREDAKEVLGIIHGWQDRIYEEHGIHFVHASDEWYILAEEELPEEDWYDGYLQLENGVGMVRLMLNEFHEAYNQAMSSMAAIENMPAIRDTTGKKDRTGRKEISMVTGCLVYPYIRKMISLMEEAFPYVKIHLYPIINHYFGEKITVSGLLTGQDIINQLKDKELGSRLLLPQNVLRFGEDIFLDDITRQDLERALQVPTDIVKSSGHDFVSAILKEIR